MGGKCLVIVGVIVVVCNLAACGRRAEARLEAQHRAVEAALHTKDAPIFVSPDREGVHRWNLTREFYDRRDYALAWIDGNAPTGQMDDLIRALQHADREGLDPSLYNVTTLVARRTKAGRGFLTRKGFNRDEAIAFDIWLTYLYMQYASDLANGLSDLSHADRAWQIQGDRFDPSKTLAEALQRKSVARSLDELTQRDPQYVALRDMLERYRGIANRGGWPLVPATLRLKPGQRSAALGPLARRLSATGDLQGNVDEALQVYGLDLQDAVKRFQRRHGLEANGIVGPDLVAELNVAADVRVRQLALNLERWRWLPRQLGERHILVNIPEYRLEVWDHGRVPLAMNVVVGKKDTPTPIFADQMTHVVFAPYWNIPSTIVQNETIPSALNDPAFLRRAKMEVLDRSGNVIDPAKIDMSDSSSYRFRQRPGNGNALGLVKFMFPNQYNVYLHDTPADSLFSRVTRSLSHGCVRVEQPEALAEYVLGDQPSWTRERIEEAMHSVDEKTVRLRSPLPVYLGYWTARVSSDGLLQFRRDVYGIDSRQTSALMERLARLRARAAAAAQAADESKPPTKAPDY
jgi:murein L,D-transpeptidase YcbB/YkuD